MSIQELPHDTTIEQGLFCILLCTPDKFSDIADKLVPNDFFSPAHQTIWKAMLDLFAEGKEIDFPTLRIQLKKYDDSPLPALDALAQAMNETVQEHHLLPFVEEIKNKSLLRQIIRASKSHAYSGQLDGAKATDLLATIEKDVLAIVEKMNDSVASDAPGILAELKQAIKDMNTGGWKGLNTGFSKIDDNTGGLLPSHIWIVGAYTGTGKTFFILQVLLNVLRQGGRVALFSTEMSRAWNMLRLVGNISGIGAMNIYKNYIYGDDVSARDLAYKELEKYGERLKIYDTVFTTEEIRLKIKKLQLNGGVDVVAVDYIQTLKAEGSSIYEKMSNAANDLALIAQELKPTILIGSQIPQDAANGKMTGSIDFKGAGEIAAIADVALWITKKSTKVDETGREIHLRKVRHGTPETIDAILEFPSGRMPDVDPVKKEDAKEDGVTSQLKK